MVIQCRAMSFHYPRIAYSRSGYGHAASHVVDSYDGHVPWPVSHSATQTTLRGIMRGSRQHDDADNDAPGRRVPRKRVVGRVQRGRAR